MKNILLLVVLTSLSVLSLAQAGLNERKKQFNTKDGIAISGYDPVAYFKSNKAVEGKKEFTFAYQGLTYYFSTAQNAADFKNNPAKYEPQYGGWCAYAMGKDGSKVEIDPGTYKIKDGKLYVFYNKFFNNTLKSWNKDEIALMKNADVNWQKFYHN